MKRLILIAVLCVSLTGMTQAQHGKWGTWFDRKSEAEPDKSFVSSAETYLQNLIDVCGIDEFHHVIDLIEKGTLSAYVQSLIDKGNAYSIEYIQAINYVNYMASVKTGFAANGKYYVLTYKPTSGIPNVKDIYLYRRDDDSMRIASGVIRQDYCHYQESSKQLMISIDDREKGSVYKIADSIVVIVTKTIIRDRDFNRTIFNTLMVFVPDGNYGYNTTYFEPVLKSEFDINQVQSERTDDGFKLKYQSGTIEFKFVGNNLILDDNSTIKLDRKI